MLGHDPLLHVDTAHVGSFEPDRAITETIKPINHTLKVTLTDKNIHTCFIHLLSPCTTCLRVV